VSVCVSLTAQSVGRSVSHLRLFKFPPPFQRYELMQPLCANSERAGNQDTIFYERLENHPASMYLLID